MTDSIEKILERDGRMWREQTAAAAKNYAAYEPLLLTSDLGPTQSRPTRRAAHPLRWISAACFVTAMTASLILLVVHFSGSSTRIQNPPAGSEAATGLSPIEIYDGPITDDMVSKPWKLLGADGTGRALTLFYDVGGGCGATFVGFKIDSTNASVTLTALSRPNPSAGPCPAVRLVGEGILTLPEPLGDRTLLHGEVTG